MQRQLHKASEVAKGVEVQDVDLWFSQLPSFLVDSS